MVQVLDTTLREGEQTPGVYFPPHAKLAIATVLEEVGVGYIEAGHPAVSPNIEKAVRRLCKQDFVAKVAAHSRSVKSDVDLALDCGVDFLGIFYCVSSDRLSGVFNSDLRTAIDNIAEVIAYAKEKRPEMIIRYTPEDTVRSDFNNVLDAARAAVEAGANIISVADTTGYMIPNERSLYEYVLRLREGLSGLRKPPLLAVHCHNDRGLAVANALDAYRAGIDIIDTTVLGLGERAGLVDLAQMVTLLTADFGETCWNLKALPKVYEIVSTYCRIPIPPMHPIVGQNAFTHCAGVHTNAATKNPVHYQSLNPALVGREMEVCLDHMSGLSSVKYALEEIGEGTDDKEFVNLILAQVKGVGEEGRVVGHQELKDIVSFYRH